MDRKAEIERAIRNYFSDTSLSANDAKEGLEEISELAQELADAIDVEET